MISKHLIRLITITFILSAAFVAEAGVEVPTPAKVRGNEATATADPLDPTQTIVVDLATGFGWHICDVRPVGQPLEQMFECPGLLPTLDSARMELRPVKTVKPEWRMWSATYRNTQTYHDYTSTIEMIVSYAKLDGEIYAFIEGRISTKAPSAKNVPVDSYFQISALGGFDKLNTTHHYGHPAFFKTEEGWDLEYAPVVTIAKKTP